MRQWLTTIALLLFSGISLLGAAEAVRLATQPSNSGPSEAYRSSQADIQLRDRVLSPELPELSAEEHRRLATDLDVRLRAGDWKLSPWRLRRNTHERLGKNLFFIAKAWAEIRRDRFNALPEPEKYDYLDREVESLRQIVARGRALPESERDLYLEGVFGMLDARADQSERRGRGMWPNVLIITAAKGKGWWDELPDDEQRQWTAFARELASRIPPEILSAFMDMSPRSRGND